LATAAVATAAALVVPAGLDAVREPTPTTAAAPARQDDGRWSAYGVTLVPPAGWVLRPTAAADDRHQACLGPADDPGACALLLAVSARPRADLDERLDPVQEVLPGCRPEDPRFVQVERTTVGGRPAARWTGRCTEDSPAVTAWALDSYAVMLSVSDPADAAAAEVARATFATVRVPEDWPTDGVEWATSQPTASAS
ncbi:MAG TPA: hypothetical protein VFR07_08200, partial [Mycobacteriales bacterium]|nr:hypothetical protein [Mycobacteriales bacterium]